MDTLIFVRGVDDYLSEASFFRRGQPSLRQITRMLRVYICSRAKTMFQLNATLTLNTLYRGIGLDIINKLSKLGPSEGTMDIGQKIVS